MACCKIAASTPTFSSLGNPWQSATPTNVPTYPACRGPLNNVLNTEVAKAIFELGVAWSATLREKLYRQPDQQHVGWRAAVFLRARHADQHRLPRRVTGIMPAADSIVRSFGNLDIATNRRDVGSADHQHLPQPALHRASNADLDPVQWAISMPWAMFHRDHRGYSPCAYLTYRCTNDGDRQHGVCGQRRAIRLRDEMRRNVYVPAGTC